MADRKNVVLRLHDFLPSSRSNGPGNRAVIWFQGCTLACPGCFNPATHAVSNGKNLTVGELVRQIQSITPPPDGITISGGEPLQQLPALLDLLSELKTYTQLPVILFSGYTMKEIQRMHHAEQLFMNADVLIAGRYQQKDRIATGLLGSSNKTMHFLSDRLSPADFIDLPDAEIILTPQGEIIRSGINPII